MDKSGYLVGFSMVLVIGLLVSNISASNVWYTGTFFSLSAAEIIFPITYIINDLLCELFDTKKVVKVTLLGILITFVATVVLYLTTLLPTGYTEYQTVFGFFASGVTGITISSFVAFATGSLANVLIMKKFQAKDKDKKFFKRAILSSIIAEFLDSFVFITCCCIFAPQFYAWNKLLSLVVTIFLIKIVVEVLIFPLTNFLRKKLTRKFSDVASPKD